MDKIKIICENSHRIYTSIDGLEDILNGTSCPICGGQIQNISPPLIEVGCSICGWSDNANLNDAIFWLHEGCPNCKQLEDKYYEVHLAESSDYTLSRVKAYRPSTKKDISELKRNGRPDYWELLIHFCQIDELISILDQKIVHANPTGYFNLSAVCLTETPIEFSKEIRKVHGEYGVAFKKSDIIRSGGMPAIYIIPSLMDKQKLNGGFCNQLKPYINILRLRDKTIRKKHDFLHEREWRFAKDIEFDEIYPVGIVLSESLNSLYGKFDDIKKLEKYIWEYGEIQIDQGDSKRK